MEKSRVWSEVRMVIILIYQETQTRLTQRIHGPIRKISSIRLVIWHN